MFAGYWLTLFIAHHPAGMVTTFAGSSNVGYADGVSTMASFNSPWAITADRYGQLYVAEQSYGLIRLISPTGQPNSQ